MSIITITTDWGLGDPDLASLKGLLLKHCGIQTHLIDINTEIVPHDFLHAAYTLKNCYADFPEKTIHLVMMNLPGSADVRLLLVEKDNHFFIIPDSGFISLCFDTLPEKIYELSSPTDYLEPGYSNRNFITSVCKKLLKDNSFIAQLKQVTEYKELHNTFAVKKENMIIGMVLHVDAYENIITNITKPIYEEVGNGRSFVIRYRKGTEEINKISNYFKDVIHGERLCLFDTSGYLKIALNQGKAASLLGVKRNDQITIEFK